MTQNFYDILRNLKITGQYEEPRPGHLHKGIDVALPLGSPIRASIGGKVKGIYNDPKGYGNYMDVFNPETGITTRYAHAQGFDVPVGTDIMAGQILGKSGATGRATGPHLHFEARKDGKTINPMELNKIMANLQTNDLGKAKTDLVAQQMGTAQPPQKDEKQQLFDDLVKQEIQNLMTPQQYQPTRLGDIIPAFQQGRQEGSFGTGAAAGLGKLGDYLGTSQGQNVLGSLFGMFGNKDMALAMSRGAEQERENELLKQKYGLEAEAARQNEMGDLTQKILGITSPKGGSSFKDMADFYYSQGMIDKDKYDALQNTDLYTQDISLPPSVMGKSLQPFLNKQSHGYKLEEIKVGRATPQIETTEKTEETLAKTLKTQEETKKMQEELKYGRKLTPEAIRPISDNKTSLGNINRAIESVTNYPKAFGMQNIVGDTAMQRIDPKGVEARRDVANLGSLVIHDRSGAAVTAKEFPRLAPFIPNATDTPKAITEKLKGFKKIYEEETKNYIDTLQMGGFDVRNYKTQSKPSTSTKSTDPLGLGI